MKVLIIKTGATETFDLSFLHPGVISLGDVIRSTPLLSLFVSDDVTWFTSLQAKKLIEKIPEIKNVITDKISLENFDLVVNLEQEEDTLSWIQNDSIKKLIGFSDRCILKTAEGNFSLADWPKQSLNWSEKLFALFGKKWSGENYYLPLSVLDQTKTNSADIGLNWQVGIKWPTKMWAKENWSLLENQFSTQYKVSWQEGFDDLIQYMNWINSCRILVTHDSLGLHIARALNKKVIVLFGPTSSVETPLGEHDHSMSAKSAPGFDCLPCYKDSCHNKIHCMNYITVEHVVNALNSLLG